MTTSTDFSTDFSTTVLRKVHEIISAGWIKDANCGIKVLDSIITVPYADKTANCHCLSAAVFRAHGYEETTVWGFTDDEPKLVHKPIYTTFEILSESIRELRPDLYSQFKLGEDPVVDVIFFNDRTSQAAVLQVIEHAIKMVEFLKNRPQISPTRCSNPTNSNN